jgi:radical SAM/CxCxxxxC motif protein YfkAB
MYTFFAKRNKEGVRTMSSIPKTKRPLTPAFDPWDVWETRHQKGHYSLTSVEFTVTQLCNLRCAHCAVGEMLVEREGIAIDVDSLIRRLDEIEDLQTISLTGGEPIFHRRVVQETIVPLLKYAQKRGLYTQLNSNLTLPLARYEDWIGDLDVLHISYNYRNEEDFARLTTANFARKPSARVISHLFQQMIDNAQTLSDQGVFVSAETFLSPQTAPYIETIHQQVAAMGCRRHEVHPLYPSDFAKNLALLSLDEYRETVHRLLDARDPDVWILFGTLPFYPCSQRPEDQQLWQRLFHESNVTVRQDPDGRNRLNVNVFTGDVIVTDFADLPPLGNIHHDRLDDVFARWLNHPLAKQYHCFCPQARCTGPNLLVANTYYPNWDFQQREAQISL